MIRISFFVTFFLTGITSQAQFNLKSEITVSDTLNVKSIEWIDADNDSLLDVLLVAKTPDSTYSFFLYKNIEAYAFSFLSSTKTAFSTLTYTLTDFDLDNAIDIVVSGTTQNGGSTNVYLNKGDFQFELLPSPLLPIAVDLLKMDDLNLDGRKELILSGGDVGEQINIYKKTSSGWLIVNDSIKVKATGIIIGDFDSDLNKDIFLTGTKNGGSSYSSVLFNEGYFFFTKPVEAGGQSNTKAVAGDFNHDGTTDIFIAGSQLSRFLISNGSGGFFQRDTLQNQSVRNAFAGDLNSDGRIDVNIIGINESAQLINSIKFSTGETLQLPNNQIHQRFGDTDRDGDLDLIQLDELTIKLFENETVTKNIHPGKPSDPFAIMIFDRLFAYWNKSADDHTPTNAVTYDLAIQSQNEEILVGDFDIFNRKRMLVSSGNNESHNFTLLKDIPQGPFELYIQSVDNAYHAGGYGICHGQATCADLNTVSVTKCGEEIIPLTSDNQALWFSFRDGYLGTFEEYPYEKASADTVFAFTPSTTPSCTSLKVFLIEHAGELVKKESFTKHACEGSSLTFTAEPGWAKITWSSSLLGIISQEPVVNYTATKQDTILVELTDNNGCQVLRETTVIISKPELSITSETYQILKGESVQLHASGGDKYLWQPASGLNDPTVASPTATPSTTTEYQVTVYDSLDCTAQGKILVIVEETAFIPNLFTPNEDGKNDVLKIYGLSQAGNFSLSIFNREGSLVYKTSNVQEATSSGWNGTVRGVLQPAGVYHWKVQGEYWSGKRLLLNGKETGSIILIR